MTAVAEDVNLKDLAFNRGCDARLGGLPMAANPYLRRNKRLRDVWFEGWRSVDTEWGTAVRWPRVAPRLPRVRNYR